MKTDVKIKYYNLKVLTKKDETFFGFGLDLFIGDNLKFSKLISKTISKFLFSSGKSKSDGFSNIYHKTELLNNTLFLLYHMYFSLFVLLNQLLMP